MSKRMRQVRRAVILAAGMSHRLDPLKLGKPKPMIEVGGQPLLARHLTACAREGIEEVYINLHYLPDQIRNFAGDGSRWGLKIRYNLEPAPSGTAGGVKKFERYLVEEAFLVIYGDNYYTFSLSELIESHFCNRMRPEMSVVLFRLEDISGSGVAECDSNQLIQRFFEKPKPEETKSHWVNAGLYLLEPGLLDLIPEGSSDFGHDVIPSLLVKGKRILGVKTQGRVYAVDTPELLHKVAAQKDL